MTIAATAMVVGFKVAQVMRSMLLRVPGSECAERVRAMLVRMRLIFATQMFFTILMVWNMKNSPPMMPALLNHQLPADKPCPRAETPLLYHDCICKRIDPHYLKHDCNLTAGVAVNAQWHKEGSAIFGPFVQVRAAVAPIQQPAHRVHGPDRSLPQDVPFEQCSVLLLGYSSGMGGSRV